MIFGRAAVAALIGIVAFATVGCGGGGEDGYATRTLPNGETVKESTRTTDETFPEPRPPKGAPQAPKGASPVLKEIYRQFPPPKPDPRVKASGKAIAAGKAACSGKTPIQVESHYYPIAVGKGMLDPSSPQAKTIAEIGKYAKHASGDASFVAGQLAAGAYQATLPPRIAAYGYQGCVYALARELEQRLAPSK